MVITNNEKSKSGNIEGGVRYFDEQLSDLILLPVPSGSGLIIRHVSEDEFGNTSVTDVVFEKTDLIFLLEHIKAEVIL